MKKFLSKYIHWILFIFLVVKLIFDFTSFTFSKQDIVALIFGIVGLLGATYLAYHIETQKRREQD